MTDGTTPSRRAVVIGGFAALGAGLVAAFAFHPRALFGPHYAPTPFDDLLSRLPDRENASRLGGAVLKQETGFDAGATATRLRARLGHGTLADAMAVDLRQHRLAEVHGWVLPETLTALCALAARVSTPSA